MEVKDGDVLWATFLALVLQAGLTLLPPSGPTLLSSFFTVGDTA